MIELMIQVFIEVRITYLSQHNQLPAVLLYLWRLSHLLPSVKDKVSQVSSSASVPSSRLSFSWIIFKNEILVSNSSECLALMNTLEEMGQARDTSTHVTFNALHSIRSPRIFDSLLYCSIRMREMKNRIFKCCEKQNFETELCRS